MIFKQSTTFEDKTFELICPLSTSLFNNFNTSKYTLLAFNGTAVLVTSDKNIGMDKS
jgi:hypothetical protein